MQMSADNPNSRQMLRDSMNDLRQSLSDAGLNAGSLDVGSQSSRDQTNNAHSGQNGQILSTSADAEAEEQLLARLSAAIDPVTQNKLATDGPLDVHV